MLSKLATVPDTDNKHEYLYWYLVVLEDGEHDLLELSLDHEQLQHLHHEPAQSSPHHVRLQLNLVAVQHVIVKVHVIPKVKPGLWIRIYLLRIRIQLFFLNADPDSEADPDQNLKF